MSDGAVTVFAPAKINLYLHVIGRRADGYHLLDSLVVFADIGDRVTAAPADALSLTVTGPEAAALAGLGADNLVLRAANRLAAHYGIVPRAALTLEKNLPAASGIGGGSSDAAATLRALAALWGVPPEGQTMSDIAASLGADVPACLAGRPVWVAGIGEFLDSATALPPLGIVLANPRRELPTAAVFRAREGAFAASERPSLTTLDPAAVIAEIGRCRNDLTAPALALAPEIAAVLDRLSGLPQARLARMSGSGATCFALFTDSTKAHRAAEALRAQEPGWWIAAGEVLSGPPELELAKLRPAAPERGS